MISHLLAETARYRYGRSRGSGMVFYYLFRWLYSLIGAWAYAVETAFIGACLAVSALLKRSGA